MIGRLVIVLAVMCGASPAFALDACFTESVGPWRGPVFNEGRFETMDSEFRAEPDGTLSGTYRMHGSSDFDGKLTGFRQTGPCEVDFIWTDDFGKGLVHIRFQPENGRFIGSWGIDMPVPSWTFDGYRAAPQTS
jgi:hypothetical protein